MASGLKCKPMKIAPHNYAYRPIDRVVVFLDVRRYPTPKANSTRTEDIRVSQ